MLTVYKYIFIPLYCYVINKRMFTIGILRFQTFPFESLSVNHQRLISCHAFVNMNLTYHV